MDMKDDAAEDRAAKAYCWTFGNAEFDEGRWQLRVAGNDVELERKPLEVLQYLLRHAGEAVTKDELLGSTWAGRVVVEAVLTNAIGKLRKALGDEGMDIVMTLPRVGYRLAVPVSRKTVEFVPTESRLEAGDTVPRRSNWCLETALARTDGNEVWLARHGKTKEVRVFKFSLAGKGLNGLKREVTIARLLREALGERDDFVHVLDWDFEEAPFFVESDYGGVSLDRWPTVGKIADVPLSKRLDLFVQAAEAVAAAHGIGVLHKDLKPANLLIYGEGDEARLRVADFGSSRLFDSGRLDELGITHLGLTQTASLSSESGTPLYLAPEVIGGSSASIKSDVYALGVTLYQFLVGDFTRPLAPGWESDIDDSLLRQDIGDAANGDPAKRLDSSAMLADQIRNLAARREQRELELAVQARVAEGEKRLAKLRARRPWMIAAMLALTMGASGSMLYALQAGKAERMAIAEKKRADDSLRTQQAMNNFLVFDLIGSARPDQNEGQQITLIQAIDHAEAGLAERFKDDPVTEANLRAMLRAVYSDLGQLPKAKQQAQRAVTLFEKALPGDVVTLCAKLGLITVEVNQGLMLDAASHLTALEKEFAGRVDIPLETVFDLNFQRATTAFVADDFDAADKPFRNLMTMIQKHQVPESEQTIFIETNFAKVLASKGRWDEAETMARGNLQKIEGQHGRRNSATISAREALVGILTHQAAYSEASKQLGIMEEDILATSPDSPVLGNVYIQRADLLYPLRRYAEAAEQYRKAGDIFRKTMEGESLYSLAMLEYRGKALRDAGDPERAVAELQEKLEKARRILGEPSPVLFDYAATLALAALDSGDLGKAKAVLPLLHVDQNLPETSAPELKAKMLYLKGRFLLADNRMEEAATQLKAAVGACRPDSRYCEEMQAQLAAR